MTEPYQILVAGSGVMGRGIALSFARTGHRTAVLSRDPAGVAEIGEGVEVVGEPPAETPELIIESLPEVAALKRELYSRLEATYGGAAIVPHLYLRAEPNDVVQAKHREGRLGIKTGTGFYDWRAMDVPAYQKASAALLARVLDALEGRRPSPPPLSRDDDG